MFHKLSVRLMTSMLITSVLLSPVLNASAQADPEPTPTAAGVSTSAAEAPVDGELGVESSVVNEPPAPVGNGPENIFSSETVAPAAVTAYNAATWYVSNKVGIRTDNPQAALHVNAGDNNLWGMILGCPCGGSAYGLKIATAWFGHNIPLFQASAYNTQGVEVPRFNVQANGNVGIGTTLPAGPLHLNSEFGPPPSALSAAQNGLLLGVASRAGYKWIQSYGGALSLNPTGNRVGIGTTTPQSTLDVNGTTTTKVLQITGGADLAEPFAVADADTIEPGLVMAIDPDHPGQLRLATKAYDRTVAGVISGAGGINPGLILQQEDSIAAGQHPVALTGRVYVWADASAGAIQAGDLLTTSDTPGHAMRVSEYELAQGAILGKAMSSLEEGTGLVLVLVGLQ
jgi:hypothetical protein